MTADPSTLSAWHEQRVRTFYAKADLAVPDEVLRGLRARSHDQLGLTSDRIAALCHPACGRVTAVEPLAQQGTFHRLFHVRGCAGTCVFRANAASDLYHDLLFHLDPWLAARLRGAGVPVPRVFAVDTSRSTFHLDYQLLEEVPGTSLERFHNDEPRLRALLRRLGVLAARLHQVRLDGFGPLDVRPLLAPGAHTPVRGLHGKPRGCNPWACYLGVNLAEHVASCVDLGAITAAEGDQVLTLFADNAGRLAVPEPRLLHGDLGSHNVLTGGTDVTGLIDWEDCLAGDPAFDVASWATFQPEHRHPAFLEGYRSFAALPDDFEPRFWLYYLRVSLAKTVHRHRFAYADRPGRPPAALRIRRGLDGLRRAA
jgi:fructosamine-3-kinase